MSWVNPDEPIPLRRMRHVLEYLHGRVRVDRAYYLPSYRRWERMYRELNDEYRREWRENCWREIRKGGRGSR